MRIASIVAIGLAAFMVSNSYGQGTTSNSQTADKGKSKQVSRTQAKSKESPPKETPAKETPAKETPAKETPRTIDKRVTEEMPVVVKTLVAPKTEAQTTEEAFERAQKSKLERLTAYSTVAAASITLALAIFTAALWWSTRKLVKDAKTSSEIELRAYVSVDRGTISFERNDTPAAEVILKNFGKTPAYDVRCWIHLWIEEHPLKVSLPTPSEDLAKTDAVIGPGNTVVYRAAMRQPVPVDTVHLLGTPKGTIYVYGRIEYRDIFNRNRFANYRLICGGQEPMERIALKSDSRGNFTSES